MAAQTDQPVAGLLKDLKQRGMLDEDIGAVGRRVRTLSRGRDSPGRQRRPPRPPQPRLHDVDGRRRHFEADR